MRFVAFDVETPNHFNNRMSAIGIAVIEDGEIVYSFHSLVNPEADFDYFNTQLTGINADMVADAPTFTELWEEVEPILSSGLLVAHNASFDMSVLKKCLQAYPYINEVRLGEDPSDTLGPRIMYSSSQAINLA